MFAEMIRRFLYYPERIPQDAAPPPHAAGASETWIRASDGVKIHGLYWPPAQSQAVILFFHGNAGHVYDWALVRQDLGGLGTGLLIIDYRGYGKSEGAPTEEGLYADGRAALAWLISEGVTADRVVAFGKSLGGGVACEIARGARLRGLVLESTFTSIPSVANRLFPVLPAGALIPDRYESVKKIGETKCPILVIHGTRDDLIPLEEGKRLFEAAPEPKQLYLVENAGHNDVSWIAGPDYSRTIARWLATLDKR